MRPSVGAKYSIQHLLLWRAGSQCGQEAPSSGGRGGNMAKSPRALAGGLTMWPSTRFHTCFASRGGRKPGERL